ncbi:branched-chain amino acid transporter AzlD [Anoxybacterium hadale]|uniref:Branched-chain amino acid transporter AzlD n=1 Tax=Anoxybacterium hadale TaxID=3408580 RepID=A0ACD1AAP5_9FIRM|nr:branched-chain amino acid transporter AzlD [Clostridiales bacterium]
MTLTFGASALIILVISAVTFGLRAAPFLLFSRSGQIPKVIVYLGNVLPPAVMGMLIVYCLKNVSMMNAPHGIPELIAVTVVVGLHLWRKNNLLSIIGGTAVYMFLVQFIFV